MIQYTIAEVSRDHILEQHEVTRLREAVQSAEDFAAVKAFSERVSDTLSDADHIAPADADASAALRKFVAAGYQGPFVAPPPPAPPKPNRWAACGKGFAAGAVSGAIVGGIIGLQKDPFVGVLGAVVGGLATGAIGCGTAAAFAR